MKWLWTLVVSLVLIAAGVGTMQYMMATKPQAKKRQKESFATPVEVASVELKSEKVEVTGYGVVIPSRELELTPEVTGRIVSVNSNLVPGGVFSEGEEILKIDKGDYEAALKLKEAQLADATYSFKVEQGQQAIAEREWELLEKELEKTEIGRELALRKPHLARAQAALDSAKKAVERAKWEVDRTTVTAPFNCVVKDEYVEKEQRITPQNRIATLIGTDSFRVRVSVQVADLAWIDLPDRDGNGGSEAAVRLGTAEGVILEKEGRVVRVLPDLATEGRMARLLVEVSDPLGLNGDGGKVVPLNLGSYVTVKIEGMELTNVVELPSNAVHEGNAIHVMNARGELEVRKVVIAWRKPDSVLVRDDLKPGEKVVVSRIPVPIPGMQLRTVGNGGENEEPVGEQAQGSMETGGRK